MTRKAFARLAAACLAPFLSSAAAVQGCADIDMNDMVASANASPPMIARGDTIVSVDGQRDTRVVNITERGDRISISCNAYVTTARGDGRTTTLRMSITRTLRNGVVAYSLAPVM